MKKNKRVFLLKVLHGVGYYAFGSLAWSVYLKNSQANADVLRPPGAMKEKYILKTIELC